MSIRDIEVLTKDQLGTSLNNVLVRVYSGATLVVQGTSAAGSVTFSLEDGTYTLRSSYSTLPYTQPTPYNLVVAMTQPTQVEVELEVLSLPPATSALHCQCTGTLVPDSIDDSLILDLYRLWPKTVLQANDQVTFVNKSLKLEITDGYGTASLVRKGRYTTRLPRLPGWVFQVPDLAAAPLGAVLFPIVKTITPSSAVVALSIGESLDVSYDQLYYSGLVSLSADLQADGALERQFDALAGSTSMLFESNNEAVVTVSDVPGVLTLIGVAAGNTTIKATLQNPWKSWVEPSATLEWTSLIDVTVA